MTSKNYGLLIMADMHSMVLNIAHESRHPGLVRIGVRKGTAMLSEYFSHVCARAYQQCHNTNRTPRVSYRHQTNRPVTPEQEQALLACCERRLRREVSAFIGEPVDSPEVLDFLAHGLLKAMRISTLPVILMAHMDDERGRQRYDTFI